MPELLPRRTWRWAAGVWAALVLVGGGLTMWLQSVNEPDAPARWEPAPTPLTAEVRGTSCATRDPGEGPAVVYCAELSRQGVSGSRR